MTRISPVSLEQAPAASRPALLGLEKALGFTPNVFATLAHSPAALNGYLALAQAGGKSSLNCAEREAVALAVSQVNGSDYCLAAHAFFGGNVGLDEEAVLAARSGTLGPISALARAITLTRGQLSHEQIATARAAGMNEEKIIDVVAQVTLLTFTNYLNNIALTEIDFPPPGQ